MHNFYVERLVDTDCKISLPSNEMKHLFKTLRASRGDMIGLLDGRGSYAEAEVVEDRKIIVRKSRKYSEPRTKVHIFVATPKRSKMDQLLRQCTEAGVWSIHPIVTEYSVATPEKVSSRWQNLLKEACKQAVNVFLPEIYPPCSLGDVLEYIKTERMSAYYGAVEESDKKLSTASGEDVAWLVGPEGGFSEPEIESMQDAGVDSLNIGPYIMRVETAAVCGVALLNFYNKD